MANMPKSGRLVDESTGKGVPDATVIASAIFNAENPIHGSARDEPYRVLTTTDEDGRYYIPSTWGHLRLALPGMDARERWIITAYKPGYVVAADDEDLRKFRQSGLNKFRPKSTTFSPAATWLGFWVQVDPIALRRVELSLKEAVTYYRDVLGAGLYVENARDDAEVALRAQAYATFEPMICGLEQDDIVDQNTGGAFASFAFNSVKFVLALRSMEPDGFGDASTHPVFHAGSVCQALHSSLR